MHIINFFFKFFFLKKIILNILVKKYGLDFIDFGSKTGGSIAYAEKVFQLNKGLGIDLLDDFPSMASKNNFLGLKTDILKIPNNKFFDAVIMSHFLEHIPARESSLEMIEKALNISNKFVYIQQPFFDENMYLFKNGLKLTYADWRGHPNMLTSYDFFVMLRRLQEKYDFSFTIAFDHIIRDSSSRDIVNINESFDAIHFDKQSSLKKKNIIFDRNIYKEIKILITHRDENHEEILKLMRYDEILIRNAS